MTGKKKKTVNVSYAAKAMAVIAEKAKMKNVEREAIRKQQKETFIDSDDYNPTLKDFESEASIKKRNVTMDQYLEWLQVNKKRYANSAYYYNTWINNITEDLLGDEHKKIFDFISREIDVNINTISSGSDKETARGEITNLENYFTIADEELKKKLINVLKAKYTKPGPQLIMCTLYALHTMHYFKDPTLENQTHLAGALTAFFGRKYRQQNVQTSVENYNSPNRLLNDKIIRQREMIETYLSTN